MKQEVIDDFRKRTSDLAWYHMMKGQYKRAFEVMEIGRNTIALVNRVSTYKPLVLEKENV